MSESNDPRRGGDIDGSGSLVAGVAARRPLTTLQKLGIAGLVTVVMLGFVWLRSLHPGPAKPAQPDVAATTGQAFRPAPTALPAPPATPAAPALPMPTMLTRSFMMPQQREETAADSPIMAFAGDLESAAPADAPPPARGDRSAAGGLGRAGSGSAANTPLSARLHATVLDATKAELLPHPDFMLTEGTIIPCTLQTAINSELAGYVKCIIPQDIRSTTGDVVLLDKGTTVVGEIQQGLVQGQDRLFILWDRAETPDHAVIDLSSPGTDELGRAGVPGAVNNHFWERFGSAIMLSIIQGALQAGTAYAANSGGSSGGSTTETFFNQFQSNGSELANTALLNSVNIPPTLEKNQGDNVAIFVAKDLDFSDVYTLRVTGDGYGQ
jgi:type IV secretion system protein VirB10